MLKYDETDPSQLTVEELISENEALRQRLRQLEVSENERLRIEAGLRDDADRYLSILENMPDTYYRVDAEGRVQFASQTVFELLGYTPEELADRSLADVFVEPGGRDRYMEALHESGGRLHDYRVRQRRRNGDIIWVSISAQLRHDENGEIIGSQGTSRDITWQRESEEALRLSEERYALTVTAINDGLWDQNLVTGEFYQSSRWYEIVGIRKEDVFPPRNLFYELLHPDDATPVEEALARHFEQGEPYNIEIRLRHNDGHYLWARVKGNSVRDADGKPMRMLGSLSDITERMRVTEALRESEAQMRLITEAVPVLITYVDRDSRIRFANRAYAEWTGLSKERILGRHIRDVHGIEYFDGARQFQEKVLAGELVTNEGRSLNRHGKNFDFRATRVPHFDANGQVVGYFFIMVELTEIVEREEQLRQAQKMDALGQLTGGVAHEFNNLLLVIVGNLESLLKRATDETLRNPASAALNSAMRGSELTRQLLAFSREQTLDVKPANANGLVLGMRDMLQSVLGETVAITTELGDGTWPILTDTGQIESALLNLTLNARDAMPKGGVITISTANRRSQKLAEIGTGDFVMIEVSDTGTGMTEAVLERAMDPFFTTKDVGSGTGLGLSMVYGFVEQSGGSVQITSNPGEGTNVRMYLPRASDEFVAKAATHVERPAPQPADPTSAKQGRVLIVEDDPMVRMAVAQMLQDLGCRTIEAENGELAMEKLNEHSDIYLLFSDIVLPMGISGIDVANEARSRFPDLKILLSSGYPKKGVKGTVPEGDDFWFLEKPYRADELSRTIAEIFGK